MPTPRKYASAADRQAAYRQRCLARTQAKPIPTVQGHRRWYAMRCQCLSILDMAISEMDVYLDQRSDVWRDSERGEALVEMIESMTEIVTALRDIDSK
jgi:hypothetical protein